MAGELFDAPNQQAVGLDPPWVEGSGGSAETAPAPRAAAAAQAAAGRPELDEMSKEQLLEYAQQLGVSPANHGMTKDELRAGVDAKLAEGG